MSTNTMETRRESYEAIKPKRTDRRNLILEILGSRQMTASEITEELLAKGYIKYYDRNFVAPRLTELKDAGIVETVGKGSASAPTRTSQCGPEGSRSMAIVEVK
jgi:hypothetical protein